MLFADTYASYYEPHLGVAAVELLEGCGYDVIVAHAGCCQRPRLSKGMVRAAKRDGEKTLRNLLPYAHRSRTTCPTSLGTPRSPAASRRR